ncbi:MAG: tetratricopeptide repeat protein [Chitinophagaceae bacterium]|nr:tetratricopeptide repeat protein [Chitinophagaceae bacterium]
MSASKKYKGKKNPAEQVITARKAAITKPEKNKSFFFLAIIVLITVVVYGPSVNNTWTNWDDEGYVLKNDIVTHFDLHGIFSEQVMGNYHPVTVFVQALEYSLFKEDASGFHIISLLLHLLNALLLFYFVRRLTKNEIAALICSLLFAIHPAHVESVSWVSAQKDLLYTCFYFAALVVYVQYKESNAQRMLKYGWILLLFALSLLSKAQAVTLPVIMLLIDWYRKEKFTTKLLWEKVPFFVLSVCFGAVAIYAQHASDSIQDITMYSFPERLMFSAYAIISYFLRLVLPLKLSAYYPYPEERNKVFEWLVYASPVIVLLIGFAVYWFRKSIDWLVFGLLFFLINIFLVLQLLPVGGAITADRYTYLSFTGLFFAIAMLIAMVWEQKNMQSAGFRMPVAIAAACWIMFLCYQCRERTAVWYSSEQLWTDVIAKYPRVPIAYNDLGSYYQKNNQLELAKKNYDIALRLQSDFSQALVNRCDLFRVLNKIDSAIIDGNHAVRLKPNDVDAHMNRGIAFSIAEKNDSAMMDFMIAIRQDPGNARSYNNLGNLYMIKEQPDSAIINYNLALKYDPEFLDVLNNRGLAYLKTGDYQQAVTDLTTAIANMPNNTNNYYFRMQAFEKLKRYKEAIADAQQVQKMGIQLPEGYVQQLVNEDAGSN